MEFAIGAFPSVGAVIITNPIEVLKTRFQLQGELKKKGQYTVHYKNIFHAGYVIVKEEGILALQKGLIPAIGNQMLMNGVRLGGFQYLTDDKKLHLNKNGDLSLWRTVAIGAITGGVSGYFASPFYLLKIRLQSNSGEAKAVGSQHKVTGTINALLQIWKKGGIAGLWRGANSSVPRVAVASASQLGTFSLAEYYIATNTYYTVEYGLLNSFLASILGGIVVAITINPFDVISTRLYNQGVDDRGRGLLYSSYFDCVLKTWKTEGFKGFYKGFIPSYMKIAPQTALTLIFWDELKYFNEKYLTKES